MDIVPLPVPWLRQQSSPASISFLPRWIGAWVDWLFKPLATYLHPPAKAVGTLEDDGVWVDSLEDIQFLWNHGFFGKGTLSRSEPSWRFSAMKQKKGAPSSGSWAKSLTFLLGSSRSRKKGAKLRLGAAAHLATGAIGSHGQPSATETGSPDQEALQIDSCEAVFLSFFLGSLVVVYDQVSGTPLGSGSTALTCPPL
ncbi:hypothetical protein DFJ74DRAFT_68152 [Hyaloraphidium curvatum]|nr:hypothetical protein DFJ74DRAFT_68152 [Hyaloraphidium curvatum]